MNSSHRYLLENVFLGLVLIVSATGFWSLYFGEQADPSPYHHLHVATVFLWLGLLLWQVRLVGSGNAARHRAVGLLVFAAAPLLVASLALLSVHSAHKGLVSGRGDFLIIQNVGVTVELLVLIVLAFVLRKRRKQHGALLLSTAIMFMGIALFFTMLAFGPMAASDDQATINRFVVASVTGQAICLVAGLVFVIRDWRSGWPLLLAASFFGLNDWIRSVLADRGLIGPLTELVGSMNQTLTFVGTFLLVLALLALTGVGRARPARNRPVAAGVRAG
jgi:hypothetical protein